VFHRSLLVGHHFCSLVKARLFPTVELDLVWPGRAFAGFEERFQAQQEDRPFGAAVVHKFHRLLPALVLEENNGPVAVLFEVEAYLCAEPFFRPVDHLKGRGSARCRGHHKPHQRPQGGRGGPLQSRQLQLRAESRFGYVGGACHVAGQQAPFRRRR